MTNSIIGAALKPTAAAEVLHTPTKSFVLLSIGEVEVVDEAEDVSIDCDDRKSFGRQQRE